MHGDFGRCRRFALLELDADNKVVLSSEDVSAPERPSGLTPRWLREQGVGVLIAGGIGPRALGLCARCSIDVRGGTAGASVDQVVAAYLDGELTAPAYQPRPHDYPL